MPRPLPPQITLEQIRQETKDLLRELERGVPAAIRRARLVATIPTGIRPKLSDAQHVIAREYGFMGWAKLKDHLETRPKDFDARKALVAAVQAGDVASARDLLGQNPQLTLQLDEPMPELPFDSILVVAAVTARNRELVDVLLQAGADINARSRWWAGGFGVLDMCEPSMAPFLIESGAIVDANAAARLGMLDRLEELIAADPTRANAKGGDGQTPLHVAANVEVAQFLLEHGAGIDTLDIDHESTPAQYAVRDRQSVARFLVGRGCRTDLLMAVTLGDLDRARRHLDEDPACIRMSVNERYFPKRDPRAGGHIYIWTIGANRTAPMIARESGNAEMYSLVMERCPVELQLALACEMGDQSVVDSLMAGLPDLAETLDEEDRRRLADAAQDNNPEGVRLMLAAGWPVDARGQHGGTALHWAAFHGNAAMAREILRYQPGIETQDHDYHQPALGWALYGSLHGWHPDAGDYAETVEVLLEAGAHAPETLDGIEATEAVRAVLERRARAG